MFEEYMLSLFYFLFIVMCSFRYLFLASLLCLFLGTTIADFSADTFITQFQAKQSTISPAEKMTYNSQVYNNLSLLAVRNRSDAELFKTYTSLKEYVKIQLQSLGSPNLISVTSPFSGMNIPRVDLAKVREVWLTLHNTERKTKGLTPFTYSTLLEGTATTWANRLADLGKATHQRKSTDGYYSYASIKDRFIDQGITFATTEKNGQALFTENLSYGYYTCKKTDCTDDFIKAIKGSSKSGRGFFMSEKVRSYKPHYNAIVGNFSSVGLGVVMVGTKYYLVSHYAQALK